ncbi:MATE family efflux transporter [Mobilicoccus caccae]|uniref:Probable multidrug resistance protein NorM n=1 Tax=Mobilicoccus caccae TaxID=1859295 RepID=A0ABQ6IWN6_9MICO|nr:MATE family efflux transporter [Mobilicoccus caccae]GMA41476.1 hypothetical protein GCM10025883_35210 [Mobilicoccus caccae]
MTTTATRPAEIRRELRRIAVPIIGSSLVAIFVSTNDALLLAGVSARTLASVVASSTVLFVVTMLVSGVGLPAQVLAGRALGRGDPRRAGAAAEAALSLGLWVAVPLGVVVALAAHPLLAAVGGTAIDAGFAASYLRLTVLAVPVTAVAAALRGRLAGLGTTRMLLVSALVGAAVDIGASLALRALIGPLGVGMGTVLGQCASAAVLLRAVLRPHDPTAAPDTAAAVPPPSPRCVFSRPGPLHREVLSLGWPEAVLATASAGAGVVVTFLLSTSPPDHLAASRFLEITTGNVLWTVMMGFGAAATTLLARAVGAGDRAAFGAVIRQTLTVTLLAAVVGLLVVPFVVPPLIGVLSTSAIADLARGVVWLAAAQGLLMAVVVVNNAVLRSLKDTRTPMVASLVAEYVVFLPSDCCSSDTCRST